jgi:hypothetical protein
LNSYGITTDWATEIKRIRDFQDPEIAKYVPAATERMQKEKYVSMQFFVAKKTKNEAGAVVELLGKRESGHREVLAFVYVPDNQNAHNVRIALIKHYASGLSRDQQVIIPTDISEQKIDIQNKTTRTQPSPSQTRRSPRIPQSSPSQTQPRTALVPRPTPTQARPARIPPRQTGTVSISQTTPTQTAPTQVRPARIPPRSTNTTNTSQITPTQATPARIPPRSTNTTNTPQVRIPRRSPRSTNTSTTAPQINPT